MTHQDLRQLYIDELKDLYSAETQMVKALPKMAKAASSEELCTAFLEHLEETKGQVERLETIFDALEESPKGKKCAGMEGLVKEGSEDISDYEEEVRDAALIGAAQRVEHYEMAGYGTVIAFAELLGENQHRSLLQETLQQEKAADQKLTELSKDINIAAQQPRAQMSESKGKRKPSRAA